MVLDREKNRALVVRPSQDIRSPWTPPEPWMRNSLKKSNRPCRPSPSRLRPPVVVPSVTTRSLPPSYSNFAFPLSLPRCTSSATSPRMVTVPCRESVPTGMCTTSPRERADTWARRPESLKRVSASVLARACGLAVPSGRTAAIRAATFTTSALLGSPMPVTMCEPESTPDSVTVRGGCSGTRLSVLDEEGTTTGSTFGDASSISLLDGTFGSSSISLLDGTFGSSSISLLDGTFGSSSISLLDGTFGSSSSLTAGFDGRVPEPSPFVSPFFAASASSISLICRLISRRSGSSVSRLPCTGFSRTVLLPAPSVSSTVVGALALPAAFVRIRCSSSSVSSSSASRRSRSRSCSSSASRLTRSRSVCSCRCRSSRACSCRRSAAATVE